MALFVWYILNFDSFVLFCESTFEKPDTVIVYNDKERLTGQIISFCHKRGISVGADVTEWYEISRSRKWDRIVAKNVDYRIRKMDKKLDYILSISPYLTAYYKSIGCKNVIEIPPIMDCIETASVRLFANYSIVYGVAAVIWLSIFLKGKCFYSSKYWKFSLQLSLPLIGYSIASQILSVSDRLMISKMVGNSAVGVYSTLYTVSSLSLMVWTAINASFTPYLYQNMEKPKSKIRKLSMTMLGMYSLVAILLVYLAPEIVRILATAEYYKGIYIMPPIAGGVYFIAVSNLYSDILVYLKKTKMIMISSAIAALLNVVLNYLMINAYGYMAAAYTTLVSYIVMAALLSIWANREFKKNVTAVYFVYDNKMIAIISVLTLIISMLAILIYDYAFVRYAIAALIFTVTVLYGVRYLKANKDMKNKKA